MHQESARNIFPNCGGFDRSNFHGLICKEESRASNSFCRLFSLQTLMAFPRLPLILRLRQTLSPNFLISLNRQSIGSVTCFSSGSGSLEINISDEESRRRLYNRLLYRSRQRGFRELDMILGKWVEENLRSLDEAKIRSLVDVLDQENPDLWKWVSGQEQPPDAISSNTVFSSIQSHVLGNIKNYSAPATRAEPGRAWVRGWDDKRGLEGAGPKLGNH